MNKYVLKPCPWCGAKDVELERWAGMYYVNCPYWRCDRPTTKMFEKEEDAVEYWNGLERES